MVYGCFYLPTALEESLLKETHAFTDSKQLTASRRAYLMQRLCTPGSDLYKSCGWATSSLSARDISAGMLKPAVYNLNAQAVYATISLIRGVIHTRNVNVKEVFVDTLGAPDVHRRRLEAAFPGVRFTVEKKADALFPVVGAASVAAKVTRDAALEACADNSIGGREQQNWGSGYPSDARCVQWMKKSMDPIFGWGPECRFSWGTAKEMLEGKGKSSVKIDWPVDDDDDGGMKLTSFYGAKGEEVDDELAGWFGGRVRQHVF
jgi:ribonuclease H2 subunit A